MKREMIIAGVLALGLSLCSCGTPEKPRVTEPASTPVVTPDTPTTAPTEPTGEAVPNNDRILLNDAQPVAELSSVKRDRYDNGSYYYMDATEDQALRCISSCYRTTLREEESLEDYAQRRAIGLAIALAPGNPYDLKVTHDEARSDALGLPVYLVDFYTGSDPDRVCWTVLLTHDGDYSYQYAFAASPEQMDLLGDAISTYLSGLELAPMPEA